MVHQPLFEFIHYCPSDKEGYPHFLSFRAIETKFTYRLFVYVSNAEALELSICTYRDAYELKPYQTQTLQNQEAYQYLLPIFQKERLRITVDGFPIKKLMDGYRD